MSQPTSTERIGIVGAGAIATGLARLAAERGDVVMWARSEASAKRASTVIEDVAAVVTEMEALADSTIVVEAVAEDIEVKRDMHALLADLLPEPTLVATTTSSLSVAEIAAAGGRPDRFAGLHVFNPVEKMPLVEIITHARTADWVTATAHAYAKKIGKTPIVVHDSPGFYVNRILSPYMAEAALLLQEGVRMEELDRAMTEWGFPVGPITLYDEVGLDVAQKSGKIMAEALSDRMGTPPTVNDKMVEDGRLGRKNLKGFYKFGDDGKKQGPDESVYALIGNPPKKEIPRAELQDRLGLIMINEAVRTLEEGVLRSARDGDVGAVFGIGFPPFRGGPFWYVDTNGAQDVLDRLRALEQRFGARFRPAKMLEEMAREGRKFFPDAG